MKWADQSGYKCRTLVSWHQFNLTRLECNRFQVFNIYATQARMVSLSVFAPAGPNDSESLFNGHGFHTQQKYMLRVNQVKCMLKSIQPKHYALWYTALQLYRSNLQLIYIYINHISTAFPCSHRCGGSRVFHPGEHPVSCWVAVFFTAAARLHISRLYGRNARENPGPKTPGEFHHWSSSVVVHGTY